jgi:hypothetical protein
MFADYAWAIVGVLILGGSFCLIVLLVKPGRAATSSRRFPMFGLWTPVSTSGGLPMQGRLVGWIRTHWSHWEPIVWGDDSVDVWDRLRAFPSSDEDGERVVLPQGQRPVELIARDSS